MKKGILAVCAGLFSLAAMAQKVHNPGDFNDLKVFDRISAELIPSDQSRVEIEGSRSEDVEVINKNGELKIRMRTTKLLTGENIQAKVYYVKLEDIQASEGASIGSSSPVKNYEVQLAVKSGGSINLSVEADEFEGSVSTGGSLKVVGQATRGKLAVTTGGTINAKELQLDRAKADVKAGGSITVKAKDHVEARVTTGGTIDIYGKPLEVDKKVTLGGSINMQ